MTRQPRRRPAPQGGSGRSGAAADGRRTGKASPSPRADTSRRLPAAKRAEGLGGEQVEGRRAVKELLLARRRRVTEVWLADGRNDAPVLAEIELLAAAIGTAVRRVGLGRLAAAARTDAHQGVIAFAEPLPDVSLADLADGGAKAGVPFLVLLDGVTDPHNLGAVLRTAECAGATGAVLARHRSAHVTPTVAKVAAGAIEWLPIALVPGIPSALVELRRLGVWTVGLAADGAVPLFGMNLLTSPVAIVVGSEGDGLSRLTRQRCDAVARIPLTGSLESLNVSVAAAVACFEVARQRGR